MKGGLEQHDDGLEEHERAEGEAVGATGEFAAETAGNFLGSVLPEVDDEGAGREVKDGAAEGEQGVLEEEFKRFHRFRCIICPVNPLACPEV